MTGIDEIKRATNSAQSVEVNREMATVYDGVAARFSEAAAKVRTLGVITEAEKMEHMAGLYRSLAEENRKQAEAVTVAKRSFSPAMVEPVKIEPTKPKFTYKPKPKAEPKVDEPVKVQETKSEDEP